MSTPATVTLTEASRSGAVRYSEGGRRISGWWELAGGDAVATAHLRSAAEWGAPHPWAVDRRAAILRRVADELLRQRASGWVAEIDQDGGWITLRG